MKLLYYLASIGEPNLEIKTEILLNNLNYLYNKLSINFDIIINCYEEKNETIYDTVKKLNFIDNVFFYKKKGVLTELFLTNPYNSNVIHYDYIIFILDDVRILNIDLLDMIKIKNKYNIKLLSPKVINSSHSFMNEHDNLTINNFLEIYFVLLKPKHFYIFLSLYTVENKWMWGIDHLFGHYGIKSGIINKYNVLHELPKKSDKTTAKICLSEYLKEKTPFSSLKEIKDKYNPIKSIIIL
jgi:hypothetical protein